jgi:hypothetical protein
MLSPYRFHTGASLPARLGVVMLVGALLLVGPLRGWQAVVGPVVTGAASPSTHHSGEPLLCPHHAAMQAAHAAKADAARSEERAKFCMRHDAMPPDAEHDIPWSGLCSRHHDTDGLDHAVLVLDTFVLAATEQPSRLGRTQESHRARAAFTSSPRAEDIFRPPRA